MCIIVVKPAGVEFPDDTALHNCWSGNNDGFGAMWRDIHGMIQIEKGIMDEAGVIKWVTEHRILLKETDVVMHFRYGTHGTNIPGNTHPFPISDNVNELRALRHSCTRAVAHNGVLNEFGRDKSTLSDTMIFVKHVAKMNAQSFIGQAISKQYGKFAYMSTYDTMLYGDFKTDKGIFYSNDSWKYETSRVTYKRPTYINRPATIVGCDNDCERCVRVRCVLLDECDLNCRACQASKCVFEIKVTPYKDWNSKEQQKIDNLRAEQERLQTMFEIRC